MEIHYGICYYYGKNKISNIYKHYEVFKRIKNPNKTFWLVLTIDEKDEKKRSDISKKLLNNLNLDIKYIHDFNWGGTVAALHLLYQYLKVYLKKDAYIAFFEEDFTPINDNWLNDAIKYLPGNYYIGEGNVPSFENLSLCQLKLTNSRKMRNYKFIKLYDTECWTDGGFYFSTISNFDKIYDKIGIFHKGDQETKYNHDNDGIDRGEVGFPSALYKNNLKFSGLYRGKYFTHG